MKTVAVCGLAIGAGLLLLIVRQFRTEISLPISLCISVCLIGVGYGLLYDLLDWISSLWSEQYGVYYTLMLKAVGISAVSTIGANLCRDAGEGGVAGAVEFVARCEILSLSLPVLKELFELSLAPFAS